MVKTTFALLRSPRTTDRARGARTREVLYCMAPRLAACALVTALTLLGAENPWTKVKGMKSGSELRIFKKGGKQPLTAKFDEANDESIIIVVKNEQQSIPKEDIDRIDYRAPQKGSRITKESKTTTNTGAVNTDVRPAPPGQGVAVPGSSSSSG